MEFISVANAVEIAHREFGADKELAAQEFEQRCFLPGEQYYIGVRDGLDKALEGIERARKSYLEAYTELNEAEAAVVPIIELKKLRREMDEIIYETAEGETILWTCESMIDSVLEAYGKKT